MYEVKAESHLLFTHFSLPTHVPKGLETGLNRISRISCVGIGRALRRACSSLFITHYLIGRPKMAKSKASNPVDAFR